MKSFVLAAAAAAPALVGAHRAQLVHHQARQAPASVSGSGLPATIVSPPATTVGAALPTFAVSLLSTNPTAIPVASITAGTLSDLTTAPYSSPAPAATPSYMPSAPGLPDVTKLVPSNYPTLDVIAPTDSPEVQQWIQEVAASGIKIPDFNATTAAIGCGGDNAAAAADQSRCWWTCGGCTRSSDITTCPNNGQWGLTYDDGPSWYTPNLLQYLDQQNLKATMFVVGSRAISYPHLLQQEYMAGHQIAVHTWSHHYLTSMTNEQVIAELGWARKIIKDVIGVTPTFMRPPFGDIDDRVRAISMAMNLIPVMWTRISPTATFDTNDFTVAGGTTSVDQVLQSWEDIMGNASTLKTGFIVLEHDLFEQTVEIATGYILPDALARTSPKLDIMPVAQCLNMPMSDAYVELNNNATNPLPVSASAATTLPAGSAGSVQATGAGGSSGSGSGSNAHSSGSAGASPTGKSDAAGTPIALGAALFAALAGTAALFA